MPRNPKGEVPYHEWERLVVRYLARQDRTEQQLRNYLVRKGAVVSDANTLLQWARSRHFLDDRGYALRWGQARLDRAPMGKVRLEQELQGQGISRELACDTVEHLFHDHTETELASRLLQKRRHGVPRGHPRQAGALLLRYGFPEDCRTEVIQRIFGPLDVLQN